MNPALLEDRPSQDASPVSRAVPWEADSPAEYIYILGAGGSGSTPLELLLGGHPDIAPMGELAMLPLQITRQGPYRCSCGQSPLECPVWTKIIGAVRDRFGVDLAETPFKFRVSDLGLEEDHGARAFGHWALHVYYRAWRYVEYRPVPVLRHLGFLSLFHRTWARNRFFVAREFRRIIGARAVIDSSKDYIGVRDLYRFADQRMKTIFLTRDVRGVVWSALRRGMGTGKPTSVGQAAHDWIRATARSYRVLGAMDPRDWMHLRYEDLCSDLEGTVRKLCEFLGHAYDPVMLEFAPQQHHTIGGNKMRYTGLRGIKETLDWRENLSASDLDRITAAAGPLARRLGYDL